ncbi:NAD-dependent epimerase/dehydratase family protein [Streptomyces sp. NPDC086787]|uniref:NAD-dependent epimerase/dehydratase family protein n=1 Tax=Streptomyces sp. NPDC086787 TaxID=3365759 RepID=UPI00380E4EF5
MTRDLLITGASGFIGRHVMRAALALPGLRIRLVRHTTAPRTPPGHRVRTVHADLRDPASLHGLCAGTDTVLHCASLIHGSEADLHAVNDTGTRALAADALRHGVRRLVYISTAAVYGPGPFHHAHPHTLTPHPHSPTSRTRAAAETHILAAGGTVLRPHLVYGNGDRWVIPALATLLTTLNATITCTALHSAIDAPTLATAALTTALHPHHLPGTWHLNHPQPVTATDLMTTTLTQLHPHPTPHNRLTPQEARTRLHNNPTATHHLNMLTTDHWFASEPIWHHLNLDPGPHPITTLTHHTPWYRQHLNPPPTH